MKSHREKGVDKMLLIAALLLTVMGIMTVFSSSSFYAKERYNDSLIFFRFHMVKVGIGLVLLFVAMHMNYQIYRWITPIATMTLVVLLIATLFGPEVKGSHRSLIILGKQFQPSEFMKLTVIFYMAAVFTRGSEARMLEGRWLYAQFVFLFFTAGLVFIEPDLGSAMVLFIIGLVMLFIAGVPLRQLSKMLWVIVPSILFGFYFFPYQRYRFINYINSILGRGEMSHQIKQSIIGLARGGLTGVGYGDGKQKFLFLPEPFSDFALSSWGEEMGFIGICVLFLLLMIILWRGIHIASHSPDRYGYMVAGGITAMIMVNALINSGVVVNLLPTTGLPFPFLSYGGSSLMMHMMSIGILLNISKTHSVPFREFSTDRSRFINREGTVE
jgi:cell division protein FtsW